MVKIMKVQIGPFIGERHVHEAVSVNSWAKGRSIITWKDGTTTICPDDYFNILEVREVSLQGE